jgi:hypothetical protein
VASASTFKSHYEIATGAQTTSQVNAIHTHLSSSQAPKASRFAPINVYSLVSVVGSLFHAHAILPQATGAQTSSSSVKKTFVLQATAQQASLAVKLMYETLRNSVSQTTGQANRLLKVSRGQASASGSRLIVAARALSDSISVPASILLGHGYKTVLQGSANRVASSARASARALFGTGTQISALHRNHSSPPIMGAVNQTTSENARVSPAVFRSSPAQTTSDGRKIAAVRKATASQAASDHLHTSRFTAWHAAASGRALKSISTAKGSAISHVAVTGRVLGKTFGGAVTQATRMARSIVYLVFGTGATSARATAPAIYARLLQGSANHVVSFAYTKHLLLGLQALGAAYGSLHRGVGHLVLGAAQHAVLLVKTAGKLATGTGSQATTDGRSTSKAVLTSISHTTGFGKTGGKVLLSAILTRGQRVLALMQEDAGFAVAQASQAASKSKLVATLISVSGGLVKHVSPLIVHGVSPYAGIGRSIGHRVIATGASAAHAYKTAARALLSSIAAVTSRVTDTGHLASGNAAQLASTKTPKTYAEAFAATGHATALLVKQGGKLLQDSAVGTASVIKLPKPWLIASVQTVKSRSMGLAKLVSRAVSAAGSFLPGRVVPYQFYGKSVDVPDDGRTIDITRLY